jgi:flagellar motor switch protein FliN/FliY
MHKVERDAGITQEPGHEAGSSKLNVLKAWDVPPNLQLVMDIPVTVSIELGRTRMSIHELLQLKPDSVIELQRLVDEPMDVLVNGTLVAHGEVVVSDNRFGLRLTDVASPVERVKRLS